MGSRGIFGQRGGEGEEGGRCGLRGAINSAATRRVGACLNRVRNLLRILRIQKGPARARASSQADPSQFNPITCVCVFATVFSLNSLSARVPHNLSNRVVETQTPNPWLEPLPEMCLFGFTLVL